jgi:hypothetical protein
VTVAGVPPRNETKAVAMGLATPDPLALLAHAGGVLYGTELGSVTLKRVVFILFFN